MKALKVGLVSLIVLAVGAKISLFTVHQTEGALISRLGKFVTNNEDETGKAVIYGPGLHVKVPFVDKTLIFDRRLRALDLPSSRIKSVEKKDLIVDFYVQWKIKDLEVYSTSTKEGNLYEAGRLLKGIAVDELRAEFGQRTIKEVVSGERVELMAAIKKQANESASKYGMEVVDVRIKKIDFPEDISGNVYNRMRTERERVASELRAQGSSEANEIRAKAEKTVAVILAEAKRDAETIRGEGDAMSVKIYADSYNTAPEFYKFYRSLEAYRNSFNSKNDVLLLKPDSEFFKFFRASK